MDSQGTKPGRERLLWIVGLCLLVLLWVALEVTVDHWLPALFVRFVMIMASGYVLFRALHAHRRLRDGSVTGPR